MPDRNGIAILGETSNGALSSITLELLGAGRQLANQAGQPLVALFIGEGITATAAEAFKYGADKVMAIDSIA